MIRTRVLPRLAGAVAAALVVSVLALLPSPPAGAVGCTWTGGAGNHLFSDAGNWSGCNGVGGVPASTDGPMIFDADVTVDRPVTVSQLLVEDASTLTVSAALSARQVELLGPGASAVLGAAVDATFFNMMDGATVSGANTIRALVFDVTRTAQVTDTTLVPVAADPAVHDPNSEIVLTDDGELDLLGTASIVPEGPTRILANGGSGQILPAPTLPDVELALGSSGNHYVGDVTGTGATTINGPVPSTAIAHAEPASDGSGSLSWRFDSDSTVAGTIDAGVGLDAVTLPAATLTITGTLHLPLSVPTTGKDPDVASGTLALDLDGVSAPDVTPIQLSGHLELEAASTVALDVTAPICPGDELPLVHASGGITLASTHVHVDGATGSVRTVPAAGGGADLVLDGTGSLGPTDTCRSVDPHRDLVRRWYLDLLGRQADTSSVLFWAGRLDGGGSELAVVRGITGSAELARHEVTAEFERILRREPDPGGLAYWAAQVQRGVSVDRLRADLAGSNEVWQQAGHSGNSLADVLYERLLDRPVDLAGHDWVVAKLAAGWSRTRIAAAILASDEAHRVAVTRIDTALLHRAPTTDELVLGVALLRGGTSEADLAALVASSPAYLTAG